MQVIFIRSWHDPVLEGKAARYLIANLGASGGGSAAHRTQSRMSARRAAARLVRDTLSSCLYKAVLRLSEDSNESIRFRVRHEASNLGITHNINMHGLAGSPQN